MPISIEWQDAEEPTLDIDLFIRIDREGARRLRSYLREMDMDADAQVITDYLNAIADWRHKRKVQG